MAGALKNAPGFSAALRFAKIAAVIAAVAAVAAAGFSGARLAAPYLIEHLCSSLPVVWIAAQLIVAAVWMLSGAAKPSEEIKPPDHPPLKDPDLDLRPADPNPLADLASEIQPESPPKSGDPSADVTDPSQPSDAAAGKTMDATWWAIVEAGAAPARQGLRKSDTWQGGGERRVAQLRRSATMRRASRGDDLLGRAEAFIKMQYEELRIQRQESEQRRFSEMEMVN